MIGTELIALASLFGCICMLFVCAAQIMELLNAARPTARVRQPWEIQRTPNSWAVDKQAVLF